MCLKKELLGTGCVVFADVVSLILNDGANACKQSSVNLLQMQPFASTTHRSTITNQNHLNMNWLLK
jgi:hypothetical protein